MAKKKMGKVCSPHGCKCWGISVLVLGVLILLNALYGWVSWGVFVGIVVILKGLMKLLHPCC